MALGRWRRGARGGNFAVSPGRVNPLGPLFCLGISAFLPAGFLAILSFVQPGLKPEGKNEFSQGRFFRSWHFKLERDGIAVTRKTLFSSQRYHVPYECIPPRAEEITRGNTRLLGASVIFSVLTLICIPIVLFARSKEFSDWTAVLFWGVLAGGCWLMFFLTRTSLLIYSQQQGALVMYADTPTPDAVARFVRHLFAARNEFLKTKYGRLSLDQPLSQRLAYLELLRDQEVITEEEFRQLRKTQPDTPERIGPLGFKP
jgi:hypothetical protein